MCDQLGIDPPRWRELTSIDDNRDVCKEKYKRVLEYIGEKLPEHAQPADVLIEKVREPVSYTHLDVYKRQNSMTGLNLFTSVANSGREIPAVKWLYGNADDTLFVNRFLPTVGAIT